MSGMFNTTFAINEDEHRKESARDHRKDQLRTECKKIFCAYHPTEFLTNFCTDSTHRLT